MARSGRGQGPPRGEEMQAVDAPRVGQPPYAPALNPVARFFWELRRALEGRMYPDRQANQEALTKLPDATQVSQA